MPSFRFLPVFLLAWLAAVGAASAQSASPSPTPAGFGVERVSISADEIAEQLGYKFFGVTWRFSAPTYARLNVWENDGPAAETPEQPQESTDPDDVYDLDGPQTEVSLHVIQQKTDEEVDAPAKGEREREATHVGLSFSVTLLGKNAGTGLNKDAGAGLAADVAALLPDALAEKAHYTQTVGFTESMGLDQYPKQNFSSVFLHGSSDFAAILGELASLADLASRPDPSKKAAELMADWQAKAEAKMLSHPLKVYYYKGEVRTEGNEGSKVKQRAVFVMTLECSRQPFKADKGTPDPAQSPSPAAATSPR